MSARLAATPPLSVALAIPTYNNAGSIAAVLRDVIAAQPDLPVLVIDDGSTDGTGERAQEALDAVAAGSPGLEPGRGSSPSVERRVLRHPRNRGKGAALETARRAAFAAGCSHLLALDGDGQHLASELAPLLAASAAEPRALWVGARDLSGDTVQSVSRFGRSFSNFWLWAQTGVRLADTQSGMRVYPTAPVLSLGLTARRYDFEVEVLTVGARAGLPLRSVPIRVHYPPAAERVSHFDKLWDNVRISWLNTRLLAALPLRLVGHPARLSPAEPPSTVARAWTGQSLGGRLGHSIFYGVLRAFGPRPAYLLLYPVSLYFTLVRRARAAATQPVLDALLGPTAGLARTARIYRASLVFARCILDQGLVGLLGPGAVRFTSEGREHIDAALGLGRGAILLNAHVGNSRVAGAALAEVRATTDDAGKPPVEVSVVMLDIEAEAVRRVHARMARPGGGPTIIAINKNEMPALTILQALRKGGLVAIHGDRVVDHHWTWCDFLGRPAPFPTGAFAIAAVSGAPIVLTLAFALGPGRYRFVAEAPRRIELPARSAGPEARDRALQAHVQWYASRLEHWLRQYPFQWFNYYDFWKRPG